MVTDAAALDRVRRPEYTGDNRCIPCTAINLLLAIVLAGVLVLFLSRVADGILATVIGIVVLVTAVVAIYLRGYMIPGTPQLTKRYFPDTVLSWFEKSPPMPADDGDVDVEEMLVLSGAVEECAHEEDLCLADGFRSAWRGRIDELRREDTTQADLAHLLDVDPERISFDTYGEAFVGRFDGRKIGQWESHAAFLADMAAVDELGARTPHWAALDVTERGAVLRGLRIFLEACPACDGETAIDHDVVESCCRSTDVITLACGDCGARLFEARQPGM